MRTAQFGDRARRVGSFFDTEAERYDREYDSPSAGGRVVRARRAAAARLLGPGPGEVLDLGMGGGRLLVELDGAGWTVSGIDGSWAMVRLAQARLPHRKASLEHADAESLPFADASFDAVVATGVLEYVETLPRALAEAARVLRPGGRAVISFPNYVAPSSVVRYALWYPLVRVAKQALPRGRPAPLGHRHLRSARGLCSLVDGAGLRVVDVVPVGARRRLLATQIVLAARK